MDRTIRAIFIILFLGFSSTVRSQQAQELFLLANKAYEKGNYAEALRHYKAIKKKGPVLWYNMGNCYYHEQDFAHAIACWQRALKGASVSLYNDVQHNCGCAYQKLSKEYQSTLWDRCIDYSAYRLPILVVQFLFLLCWLLLFIIVWQWSKSWFVYLGMVGACLLLIYFGFVLWYQYNQQCQTYGIVIEKTAPFYVGPHTQYHVRGTAEIGDKLKLVQKRAEWYKVSKDGVIGWMPLSAIEIIGHLS